MKTLRAILILLLLPLSMHSFSQGSFSSLGFWHQRAFSGELSLEGIYRQQKSFIGTTEENRRSLYGIGGLKLHSNSYLWLPDLVMLDIDLEFNPETWNEKYLIIPNRTEVRNLNKFGLRTTVFNNKPVTIIPYINYSQSYFNRENLTNVRSKVLQWGGVMLFKNKYVPVSVSYNDMKWNQKETETGRVFTNDRSVLEGRASKSFGSRDKNELIYGLDRFRFTYSALDTTWNIINRLNLNNQVFLDSAKNYNFNSRISYFDQEGTKEFKRFEIYERMLFKLPYDFRLSASYNHFRLDDKMQNLAQNRFNTSVDHSLFLSLRTNLFAEYVTTSQTVYDETFIKAGIGFDYTKKLPIGRLNLSYHYFRNHINMKSDPAPLDILNEGHTLTDGVIELLDRTYVDINSVVVKDITGTIIYQLNFDYILIERNNFIEIQRIFGGQIPDGGMVLIDYSATQPGSYRYDLNNHNFYLGFLLFDRLVEVYYNGKFQDFSNIQQTDFLILNYFNQNIFGIRIDKGFARGGVEFDNFNSNIIPYRQMRYYFDLNGNFNNKLLLSLNASLRDYKYIEDDHRQIFGNVSGRAAYTLNAQARAELEIGYLRHKAFQTDLSMWTGRLEFSTVFRQLYLNAGLDFYRRDYVESLFTLKGVFVRATRKF